MIEKIIFRIKNPQNNKRQFFVSPKMLYNIIQCDVSYKTFVETNITWSRLRENIDYHYNKQHQVHNLSISAVQAILIMENTEISWKFFNNISDHINNGFPEINK